MGSSFNILKLLHEWFIGQFMLYGLFGGGNSAPSSPDPYAVANATTQTNQQTAAYNKALNLNNYSNPFGSQSSSISGYDPTTGAPIYNTTISANPQLQGLLSNQLSSLGNAQSQYANIGNQYQNLYNQIGNIDTSGTMKNAADTYYNQATAYLDPQFSQQQTSLESQLANQGLTPGSQAYNNAMDSFNRQKTFAYNQAQNSAQTQGQQLGLNQLNAQSQLYGQQGSMLGAQAGLLGNQFSNLGSIASLIPGYSGTGTSAANPADIGNNIYQNYQGQLNQYNANQASANQATSGLFGLGGAGMMAYALSDRRLKKNVRPVGKYHGHTLYEFEYKFTHGKHVGVMADEIPTQYVIEVCGIKMVNYGGL